MRKTISAVQARGKLGQILEEVYYRGDQYIIERAGKPMAAVVPIEQYERLERARERFFALVEKIQSRSQEADPEEVERDVLAVVEAIRKQR